MTLPNAYKGVKKIFVAEILQLIGSVLTLVGLTMLVGGAGAYLETGGDASAVSTVATGGIFTLLAPCLAILALVLNLVGLKQASADEPDRMGKAFTCAIIALVLSFVVVVFVLMHWGGASFLNALSDLAEMCAIIFTIMGVSEVTQNIARQDVADMGPKILTISVIAIVASIIAGIVGNTSGGEASIIALVLMMVAYVVFLVFLGRAVSALKKG
ncbi:MAG: hypothetical protein IJG88_04930 [Eggerthellaceae bacterium]|nr:hypothetical protein [Eggerthellaceae bacterium]